MDINRLRAVAGALIPLLSFAFIGSGIIIDDWYSGEAVRGTEAEIGWWNATVDYGAINGTIWVGENDNLIGIPDYEKYEMNYTGSDHFYVQGSIMGQLLTMLLCMATFVFGLLTATRITGWKLPSMICIAALVISLASTTLIYTGIPGIVRDDLDELGTRIGDDIPEDEMHLLKDNLTHGESFTWIFIGTPGLLISPLFFIGIKRQKLPPASKIADNFFLDDTEEREVRSKTVKMKTVNINEITTGSLDDTDD
jgi:hypothetical protein